MPNSSRSGHRVLHAQFEDGAQLWWRCLLPYRPVALHRMQVAVQELIGDRGRHQELTTGLSIAGQPVVDSRVTIEGVLQGAGIEPDWITHSTDAPMPAF